MGLAADFILVVVAGLVGGILARALRLPLLVGYVVAGVFVGPNTAGPTVARIHDIETLAEIGVALLLFSVALEVNFGDLRPVRRVALVGGTLQVLLTLAAAGLGGHYLLGFAPVEAVWFGAMASVSSTMVVLKILAASGRSTSLASRVMIGLLLLQDLAVIPLLIVLPQLNAPDRLLSRVGLAVGAAALLVAVVYAAGTWLLPPLFRRILAWGSPELFLVAVVATGVGIGAGMHLAGFSFALGAFIAGLVLSESEFSHQALADVVPLRDIFGLLFFVSVGMLFDPAYVMRNAALIGAVVAAIVLGKALIFGGIARAFGYRRMAPWIVALGLAQIGEFSFVLARSGLSGGFIAKPLYDLVLATTVVTMAISPALSAAALPLGRWWQRRFGDSGLPGSAPPAEAASLHDHVIVGGCGRAGRAATLALREAGVPYLIVEGDYARAAALREEGEPTIWGDISRDDILHAARIEQARLLLLTMPAREPLDLAIAHTRRRHPELAIAARGATAGHFALLTRQGVLAVQPEVESGLELVRLGLQRYGHDDAAIQRSLAHARQSLQTLSEPAAGDRKPS